jgi:cell division protease FtsH
MDFESIIGYNAIKLELSRILDQLKHPEKYAELGVTEPHGLLMHGVPGVGKSTMARCILEASGRRSFVCRKEKSNGDFVKEIVKVFEEAAAVEPSIILLDDLDKFANEDERHRDAEEFVTVQSCIDKVKDKRVFVVATANNIRKLPDSLTRPGRFDHILELHSPQGQDAEDIVAFYLSKKSYVADMDVKRIARLLEGRSCAQLETVINQAGAYAAFEGKKQVEMTDMIKAILRIVFEAPESFDKDPSTLPLTACHEAGHALVAELLQPDSVNLVTVLNHDSYAAGITSLHRDDGYFHHKKMMENRVMSLLAGKAAVEICYGAIDTGANSDLHRAFEIVHRFVDHYCSFGFSQFVFDRTSSNEVLDRRDSRVAAEMEHYYAQTKQLIVENREKLDKLIARLVEEKTLLGDQVQAIIRCA